MATQADASHPEPTDRPQRRSAGRQWWWWLVFAGLLLWNVLSVIPFGPGAANIPYSTFLSQLRAGNVQSVTFDGQTVSGTFRTRWEARR